MKYYSYEQQDKMRKEIDATLQKYFSEDDWGIDVIIESNGKVYNIAILKVKTEPVVRYGARTTSYTWTVNGKSTRSSMARKKTKCGCIRNTRALPMPANVLPLAGLRI